MSFPEGYNFREIWPADQEAMLRQLCAAGGKSRREMADELNAAFPNAAKLSRNSVIGKCYRLGLDAPRKIRKSARIHRKKPSLPVLAQPALPRPERIRPAPQTQQPQRSTLGVASKPSSTQRAKSKRFRAPEGFEYATARVDCFELLEDEGVSFIDVKADQCRWPLGDTRDVDAMRFCGDPKREGGPWCAHHHALAYHSDASHAGLRRAVHSAASANKRSAGVVL